MRSQQHTACAPAQAVGDAVPLSKKPVRHKMHALEATHRVRTRSGVRPVSQRPHRCSECRC